MTRNATDYDEVMICLSAFHIRIEYSCHPDATYHANYVLRTLLQYPTGSRVVYLPPDHFFASTLFFSSTAPSLLPTSVSFKNTNIGLIARSMASTSANHFLSGCPCHLIPLLSNFSSNLGVPSSTFDTLCTSTSA